MVNPPEWVHLYCPAQSHLFKIWIDFCHQISWYGQLSILMWHLPLRVRCTHRKRCAPGIRPFRWRLGYAMLIRGHHSCWQRDGKFLLRDPHNILQPICLFYRRVDSPATVVTGLKKGFEVTSSSFAVAFNQLVAEVPPEGLSIRNLREWNAKHRAKVLADLQDCERTCAQRLKLKLLQLHATVQQNAVKCQSVSSHSLVHSLGSPI